MIQVDRRLGGEPKYFFTSEPKNLMLVPDAVRDCAVFVGHEKSTGNYSLRGTAFLVGREIDGTNESEFATYLVTAKHVVDEIRDEGGYQVWLRLNLVGSGATWIATDLREWLFHPGGELVDVAVLPFDIDAEEFRLENHDHRACPLSISLTDEKIHQEAIGIGDETVTVGLFSQHYGSKRNIPIARVGNIAAMPGEPVFSRLGYMDAYLIESRSTPGLSGSPVFVNLGSVRVLDRKIKLAETDNPKFFLLGLAHGHWNHRDPSVDSAELDRRHGKDGINAGIAMVVPIRKILEVLAQDAIKAYEKRKADSWRDRNLPTMDDAFGSSAVTTTDI